MRIAQGGAAADIRAVKSIGIAGQQWIFDGPGGAGAGRHAAILEVIAPSPPVSWKHMPLPFSTVTSMIFMFRQRIGRDHCTQSRAGHALPGLNRDPAARMGSV